MATFPSIAPSYPAQKRSAPLINEINFGDGYSSRTVNGLNQNKKEYDYVWENITETESDTIETFLDDRAKDLESFTFTPPEESSSSQFICKQWEKKLNFANRATITATFKEVYQP